MTEFGQCDHCKKYALITPHFSGDICKYKICVFCEAKGGIMKTSVNNIITQSIRRDLFEREKQNLLTQFTDILDGVEEYLFATPESKEEEKRCAIEDDFSSLKVGLDHAFLCPNHIDEPQKGDDI